MLIIAGVGSCSNFYVYDDVKAVWNATLMLTLMLTLICGCAAHSAIVDVLPMLMLPSSPLTHCALLTLPLDFSPVCYPFIICLIDVGLL